MPRIGGVDFDIEHPVDRRARHVRRQGAVESAGTAGRRGAAEYRLPGGAAIDAAEHVVLAAIAVHAPERAGDHHPGTVRIHGHRRVAERLVVRRVWLHRRDVGPRAALGVELPDRAIGHPAGTGRRSVREIQDSVRCHHHVGGPVLLRLPGHRLPCFAGVGAAEQVVPPHEGNRGVDGQAALAFDATARIEEGDHDATRTAASARPRRGARRRRFGHVGEGLHLFPGHRAVGAFP